MKLKPAKNFLLIFFLGYLSIPSNAQEQEPVNKMPNILLITSEDHSPHLSSYGDTIINTPNLDKIAGEGVLFNNAYITIASCTPSRSSILTGLYPHQNGHLSLATHGYHFVGKVKNIYQMLKEAGYRTGMLGKLHLNPASNFPIDYHPIAGANFSRDSLGRYAEYAGDFMEGSEDPFFLMVNYPDAHHPWEDLVENRPRPAKIVTSEEVAVFHYVGYENERIKSFTANYYNSIQRLDECIGELMQTLLNSGKDNNTLIIYLSDHGDQMPRGKLGIYEAGTKVPFLVKWPGKIDKGITSDALISSIDIVPTILDAAGLAIPESIGGKSLFPVFNDPELDFREYLFTEYHGIPMVYFPQRSVRDKKYKLIYTLLNDRKNPVAQYYTEHWNSAALGSPTIKELKTAPDSTKRAYETWLNPPEVQLYDLENDPWEFNNIASDPRYSKVKERLLNALFLWQEETNDPLRFPEKLQALTTEHDTTKISRRKANWQYPDYLYGIK
jgi:N-sulfoglucosamine sulfohydrolase